MPTLLDIPLNSTSEVKHLEVTFDAKLTWSLHLDRRLNKEGVHFL